jgi:hypothetical protein
MANEIQADYTSGSTLYAVIRNRAGQVWCAAQQALESWGAGGHTVDDYDIPLTDRNGGRYVGDFDVDVPAGSYCVQVFLQAGASPADTDTLVCSRDVMWTGAGELTPLKILANKAAQDTTTNDVTYYDDDSQSPLMTHVWEHGASTTTRTPTYPPQS